MTHQQLQQTIEQGRLRADGYANDKFSVFEHSIYPRSSVLSGQPRRVWLDDFDTLAAAQAAFPNADYITGTTYVEPWKHMTDGDERW